jgi:hypothetical protein
LTQQQPPAPPEKPDQPAAEQASPPPSELPDQPPEASPPPPPAPTPPAKKRRVWPYVALAAVIVIIGLGIGAALLVRSVLTEEVPQVGDCLNNAANPDDMDVVDCGSADAAWSVIGNDGTWTRGDFDAATQGEVCQAFTDTQQALWVTSSPTVNSGTEGEVICLAPVG